MQGEKVGSIALDGCHVSGKIGRKVKRPRRAQEKNAIILAWRIEKPAIKRKQKCWKRRIVHVGFRM